MQKPQRIASIDIIRALTMLLMIFVNDLWTLRDIPVWLGHADTSEDRLGLADVVFPAFLFIVGLSIPFAIRARRSKGDSGMEIFRHIFQRSFALVVMGIFMVNFENINNDLLAFNKYVWEILMAAAIFLIWNNYHNRKVLGLIPARLMEVLGIILLVFLAISYRGGSIDEPSWMKTHWWGILGLIGWAYFINAVIFLILGPRILYAVLVLILFNFMNVQEFFHSGNYTGIRIIIGASNYSLVMSGVFASVLYLNRKKENKQKYFLILILMAVIFICYGLLIRPFWGISKIRATPSWTAICTGISYGVYAILYVIADIYKRSGWSQIIGPAGRSTLTCYLVPYLYYPLMALVGIRLPLYLREGYIGIIKSIIFALLIIQITWLLERAKIRLKV